MQILCGFVEETDLSAEVSVPRGEDGLEPGVRMALNQPLQLPNIAVSYITTGQTLKVSGSKQVFFKKSHKLLVSLMCNFFLGKEIFKSHHVESV